MMATEVLTCGCIREGYHWTRCAAHSPAFPSGNIDVGTEYAEWPHLGITVRDYFAAKAMAVLMGTPLSAAQIASFAYMQADEMLKEREQ